MILDLLQVFCRALPSPFRVREHGSEKEWHEATWFRDGVCIARPRTEHDRRVRSVDLIVAIEIAHLPTAVRVTPRAEHDSRVGCIHDAVKVDIAQTAQRGLDLLVRIACYETELIAQRSGYTGEFPAPRIHGDYGDRISFQERTVVAPCDLQGAIQAGVSGYMERRMFSPRCTFTLDRQDTVRFVQRDGIDEVIKRERRLPVLGLKKARTMSAGLACCLERRISGRKKTCE